MVRKNRGKLLRLTVVIAGGILPALIILWWALWTRTPYHRGAVERSLTQVLGQTVVIAAMEHPRPDTRRLKHLQIGNPTRGKAPLIVDEVLWKSGKSSGCQHHLLSLGRVQISAEHPVELTELVQSFADSVLNSGVSSVQVEGKLASLEVWHPSAPLTFTGGQFQLAGESDSVACVLRLWSDEANSANPVEIRFVRSGREKAVVAFGFHTGSSALSAGLLGQWLPGFLLCGNRASFQGYVWCVVDERGKHAEFVGRLTVPLIDDLFGGIYLRSLRGTAELWIEKARWTNGRWQEAAGILRLAKGEISDDFLRHLWSTLGLQLIEGKFPPQSQFAFHELCIRFALVEETLWLYAGATEGAAFLVGSDFVLGLRESPRSFPWPEYVWMLLPPHFQREPYPPEFASFARSLAKGVNEPLTVARVSAKAGKEFDGRQHDQKAKTAGTLR